MGEYGSGRVELRASAYDRAARDEEEAAINAVRSQFRRQGSTTSRSVVAAAVAISDAVSGVERLQPLVHGRRLLLRVSWAPWPTVLAPLLLQRLWRVLGSQTQRQACRPKRSRCH